MRIVTKVPMKRTTIFISPKHVPLLTEVALELGLYPAEVIRLAMDQFFARRAKRK